MAVDGNQDLVKLKAVMLTGDEDFSDYTEAREKSMEMKEALTNATFRLVQEVTRIKEEALNTDHDLDKRDEASLKAEEENHRMRAEINVLSKETSAAQKNMERKRLQLHRVVHDQQTYEEALKRTEGKNLKPLLPVENGAAYLLFLTLRGETWSRMQKILTRTTTLLQIDPKAWSASRPSDPHSLTSLAAEVAEQELHIQWADRDMPVIESLRLNLQKQSFYGGEVSTEEVTRVTAEAKEVHAEWKRKVLAEEERRQNYDAGVDEFMKEQRTLIEWCRTQKDTLTQLPTTGSHVQGFCTSLQGRIPRMEENLSVLAAMGEDLIPGPHQALVEKTLVDVNKTWIDLQIFSYEALRNALLDEHAQSGLKEESQRFARWSSDNVKDFLGEVEELLQSPDESESQSVVRPVLEMCKQLQNDYAPHQLITEHICDFDVRMEVISDHYRYLLKTIMSPLTFLCQKLSAFNTGYHRKDEYDEKVRDLNDFVEVMNPSSWTAIHSKLYDVQAIVQQELDNDEFDAHKD